KDWRPVSAGSFWLCAPVGWKFHQQLGIDSYVGEFVGEGITFEFDYGRYSGSLPTTSDYVVSDTSIDGRRSRIVHPAKSGKGITGAFVSHVTPNDSLVIWAKDLSEEQQVLALKILTTLRFIPQDSRGKQIQ